MESLSAQVRGFTGTTLWDVRSSDARFLPAALKDVRSWAAASKDVVETKASMIGAASTGDAGKDSHLTHGERKEMGRLAPPLETLRSHTKGGQECPPHTIENLGCSSFFSPSTNRIVSGLLTR